MKAFTVKNTWSDQDNHGWGNGYVAIPPTSSWYGVDYNDIPVDAYKGLTYSNNVTDFRDAGINVPNNIPSDYWVVGFDTCHADDGNMTEYLVDQETCRLLGALQQLDKTKYAKEIITQVRCPSCQTLNGISHLVSDYEPELQMISCDDCGKPFYFSV